MERKNCKTKVLGTDSCPKLFSIFILFKGGSRPSMQSVVVEEDTWWLSLRLKDLGLFTPIPAVKPDSFRLKDLGLFTPIPAVKPDSFRAFEHFYIQY
jgi:hypothetical protein